MWRTIVVALGLACVVVCAWALVVGLAELMDYIGI